MSYNNVTISEMAISVLSGLLHCLQLFRYLIDFVCFSKMFLIIALLYSIIISTRKLFYPSTHSVRISNIKHVIN